MPGASESSGRGALTPGITVSDPSDRRLFKRSVFVGTAGFRAYAIAVQGRPLIALIGASLATMPRSSRRK